MESGQYFTAEVGNDAIVILRDGATLRGFYNIRLHRAGPVARLWKRQTLQCKYHGWTLTAPAAGAGDGRRRELRANDMHLLPVQVATWGPLVFNLDGKPPPLVGIPRTFRRALPLPLRGDALRPAQRVDLACLEGL